MDVKHHVYLTLQDGYTPLHTTVVNRKTQACDVIHTLLEHGADINAQTRGDEDTALHLVVEKGDFPRDFSLILMLLENNVDLSVRNRVRGSNFVAAGCEIG